MRIQWIPVGPLGANCILIWDENAKKGIVIDPGDEPELILDHIKKNSIHIEAIVCTHAHFDHIGAVSDMKKATGADICIHEAELEIYNAATDQAALWGYDLEPLPPPDRLLKEGDEVKAGALSLKVLHTPGHSPGGICLYGHGFLITGDTLFAGSIGRTDFYGGNFKEIQFSLRKIAALPPETTIVTGHGPSSTMGEEIKTNPFYQELAL
jgi:hydroxyacylglutathione hydrolase